MIEPAVQAAHIMHSPVHTAVPGERVREVVDRVLSLAVSALPVVGDDGRLVGIITKTDLLRCQSRGETDITVGDIMTRDVMCIMADTDVTVAAATMSYEGVHRLVVITADHLPIGIVSAIDILRSIARDSGYVIPDQTRSQSDRPKSP